MFKLKLKPRFVAKIIKARKGDIIICNLPEGDHMEFYVHSITPNGVIVGSYVIGDTYKHVWNFGENYDIICNAVSEH